MVLLLRHREAVFRLALGGDESMRFHRLGGEDVPAEVERQQVERLKRLAALGVDGGAIVTGFGGGGSTGFRGVISAGGQALNRGAASVALREGERYGGERSLRLGDCVPLLAHQFVQAHRFHQQAVVNVAEAAFLLRRAVGGGALFRGASVGRSLVSDADDGVDRVIVLRQVNAEDDGGDARSDGRQVRRVVHCGVNQPRRRRLVNPAFYRKIEPRKIRRGHHQVMDHHDAKRCAQALAAVACCAQALAALRWLGAQALAAVRTQPGHPGNKKPPDRGRTYLPTYLPCVLGSSGSYPSSHIARQVWQHQ